MDPEDSEDPAGPGASREPNGASITLEVDPERGIVRFQVRGRLGVEDAWRTLAKAIQDHPRFHRLWDFREADLTAWSPDDMRRLAGSLSTRESELGAVRVAAVVSRDVDFGLARMYEMLAEGSARAPHAVFRDAARAEEWLCTGA